MIHLLKNYIAFIAAAFLLGLMTFNPVAAGNFTFNGNWTYSETDAEDSGFFRQTYSAGYMADSRLTDLVAMSGSLRYNLSDVEGRTVQNLTPTLSLNNTNDIYKFSLNGTYTFLRVDNQEDRDSWNWSSNISSSWIDERVPDLRAYFTQAGSTSESRGTNYELRSSTGFGIGWDYITGLNLGYRFAWSDNNVRDTGANNTSTTQAARLLYSKLFFRGKAGINFAQNYNRQDSEFTAPAQEGVAYIPVIVSQASYELTDDPLVGPLTNDASFLLSDQDQPPTTIVIDPANDPMNLGMKMDFRQVDRIYLKTNENIELYASRYQWNLYVSDDGNNWNLTYPFIPFTYNGLEQRFEFALDAQVQRYIKLVAGTGLLLPSQITEIENLEVFERVIGEGEVISRESDINSAQTNLGIFFNPLATIGIRYTFSYNRSDGSQVSLSEDIVNSGFVSWAPHEYFTTRFNINETRDINEDLPDDYNRSYYLSFNSRPLSSLDFTVGLSRTESYEAEELLNARHRYSFNSSTQLYRDLSAGFSMSYITIEEGGGDDSFGAQLDISSWLRPTLSANFRQGYGKNLETGNQSYATYANVVWRISDLMSSNMTVTLNWGDESDTTSSLGVGLNITPNPRNRFNFNYSYVDSGDITRNSLAADWFWIITKRFDFRLSGRYVLLDDDTSWQFLANLKYSFNTL